MPDSALYLLHHLNSAGFFFGQMHRIECKYPCYTVPLGLHTQDYAVVVAGAVVAVAAVEGAKVAVVVAVVAVAGAIVVGLAVAVVAVAV